MAVYCISCCTICGKIRIRRVGRSLWGTPTCRTCVTEMINAAAHVALSKVGKLVKGSQRRQGAWRSRIGLK